MWWDILPYIFLSFTFLLVPGQSDVFLLTADNQSKIDNYRIALLQFSAEWCHFSRQLAPIFEEASKNYLEQMKTAEVIFARVDCDKEVQLCMKYRITKYPTMKLLKYGRMMKHEYRGARTVEAISKFVNESLVINVTVLDAHMGDPFALTANITEPRNTVVGIFSKMDKSNPHLIYFYRTAHLEQNNCAFYVIFNVLDVNDRIAYKEEVIQKVKEVTTLKNADFDAIYSWIFDRCSPPVRELTFTNAEEITEEGLPLILLFYDGKSTGLKPLFHEIVKDHFQKQRKQINFLTADGHQFSHPLTHLGKTTQDLPLLVLDSLVHMYLHPMSPSEVLRDPTLIQQFIDDLHSDKLHREFHNGPDAVKKEKPKQIPGHPEVHDSGQQTTPPESVFRNLGPSNRRYTILHDEF